MTPASGTKEPLDMDAPERRAWRTARQELDVAQTLLADPHLPPRAAREPLGRALEQLLGPAPVPALGGALAESADRAREVLAREAQRDEPARAVLLEVARDLEGILKAEEPRRFGEALKVQRRAALWRTVRILALMVAPVVAYLVFVPFSYREGPWRGAYYSTDDFTGEAYVRRDTDISFKWKDTGPTSSMPEDHFSVIWDSCLRLEEDQEVAFALLSDDGSRLFVNGERVVNNWGAHGARTRGGRVRLSRGIHHLRVRFFEHDSGARIDLNAGLRGQAPESIPLSLLIYPGDEIDENDPCREARAGRELPAGQILRLGGEDDDDAPADKPAEDGAKPPKKAADGA